MNISASSTQVSGAASTEEVTSENLYVNILWTGMAGLSTGYPKQLQSLAIYWNLLVPDYKSRIYQPLVTTVAWDHRYADEIKKISENRAYLRHISYLIPSELDRVQARLEEKDEAAIRFGSFKKGHGYHKERGDFCLVGGSIKGRELNLFYRSLELIGGLAYDLCLIQELGKRLGIEWRKLTLFCARANVFALKGNSNEKLYPQLKEIFSK